MIGLILAASALILDFTHMQGWRPDFGRLIDPSERAQQVVRQADGLHCRIDRDRDDGKRYGSIVLDHRNRPVFVATNRLLTLTMRTARPSPVSHDICLKFVDTEGEYFQYRPKTVDRLGDRLYLTYTVSEATTSGETWGSRKPNRKWDGPIRLCEINYGFGRARQGEFVLVSLAESVPAERTRETREPFCGFVRGRDTFHGHNLDAVLTNGALSVTLSGRTGWISGYHNCPGPARTRGPWEIVVRLSDDVPGGEVGFVLRDEAKPKARKKLKQPWTREVRFPFHQSLDTAWYFEAIDFLLPKGHAPVAFKILAMDVIRRETEAEAVRLDIDTGNPLHLVRGDRAPEAVLANPSARPLAVTGRLTVTDYFGKGYARPLALTIPAGGTSRVALERPATFGTFRVDAELTGADGSRAASWTTFARFPAREVTAAWPRGEFRFGVNFHIARYPSLDRALCEDMMVAMGCKLSRSDLLSFMPTCPHREGEYRWETNDRLLKELEDHGIALDAIIYSCPYWARPVEKQNEAANKLPRTYCFPCRPGLFRDYCRTLAARYGTRVAYYEIGNEWDLTSPKTLTIDEGIAMQREAMEGLHAGCKDVVCIPNGWAVPLESKHAAMHKDFQRRMMSEAKDAYDVYAIHLHGPYSFYARNMRDILRFREEAGITQPWFSNETALTSQNGTNDEVPICVWQKILFAWSHGSTDYIWYNLRATGYDPKDGEMGYGLMTADFHPRTGMAAFSALSDTFGLHRFRELLADTDDRLVGRWEGVRNGVRRTVLAGWDSRATGVLPIRVRTDAARASVVDLMGNARPVDIVSDTVIWPLGAVPSALVLENAGRVTPEPTDLAAAARPASVVFTAAADGATEFWTLDRFAQVRELYQADPANLDRTWKEAPDLSARVRFAKGEGVLKVEAEVTDDVATTGDCVVVSLAVPGRVPVDIRLPGDARVRLAQTRTGTVTRYLAELPFAAFGLTDAILAEGVRAYVRIEEDDGKGPDGWIEYLPGVTERNDPTRWPILRFPKVEQTPGAVARLHLTALMEGRGGWCPKKPLTGDAARAYVAASRWYAPSNSVPLTGGGRVRDARGPLFYARWKKPDTYCMNAVWCDETRPAVLHFNEDSVDFRNLFGEKLAAKKVGWGAWEIEVSPNPIYAGGAGTRLLLPVTPAYVVTDFRADGVHAFDRRGHHPQGGSRFDAKTSVWTCDFAAAERFYLWHHWEIPGVPERFRLPFDVPPEMKGVRIGLQLGMGGAQYEGVLDEDFTAEPPPSPRWKVIRGGTKGTRRYPMRVIQFFAERGTAPKGKCPIALHPFTAATRLIDSTTTLDVRIGSTTGPQPRKLTVQIHHEGAEPVSGELRVRLTSWEGADLGRVTRPVADVKTGERRIFDLDLPVPDVTHLNYYGIDVSFTDAAGRRLARYDWQKSWVREPAPYADPTIRRESTWGVNGCFERSYYGCGGAEAERRYERRAARAEGAGIKWERGGIEWKTLEPSAGQLDWRRADKYVETCRRHGLALLGSIGCSWPKWVSEPWKGSGLDAYTNILARAAMRYRNEIRDWEIWNEPNLHFWEGTEADYFKLLEMSAVALRKVDPGIRVVGAVTAGVDFRFLAACATNAPSCHDLAHHPYRRNPNEANYLSDLKRVAELKPGARQWLTEMGAYTGCGGDYSTERTQGVKIFRQLLTAAASGHVAASFIYDLVDDGDDTNYSESNFGIVRSNFAPKPAYRALALLGRTFVEGKPALASVTLPDGKHRLHTYRQGRARAVWTDAPFRVRVPLAAGESAVNLMDEPLSVSTDGAGRFIETDVDRPVVVRPEKPRVRPL